MKIASLKLLFYKYIESQLAKMIPYFVDNEVKKAC